MHSSPQLKIAIVGAGISGLAVANGLLNDSEGRFDVQVYERDTLAFDSERGGYQLRIASNGLKALKIVSDDSLWSALREAWAGDASRAPVIAEPKHLGLCMALADYKAYPSSRPVPRISLRKALLQRPLLENRVHLDHKVESFRYIDDGRGGVEIRFDRDRTVRADILIAADGSGSQINRQVGLNNKRKLAGYSLIQSRACVDEATKNTLPKTLLDAGSLLFLGGSRATGFASIYDPTADGSAEKKSNVFWSVLIPRDRGEIMIKQADHNNDMLIRLLLDYFRAELGYGEELPSIVKSATDHVRTGLLTSSSKPAENWRDDVLGNERVILLGDAVHPMTPGRGMGANQALADAGQLVTLFRNAIFADGHVDSDELGSLVEAFEGEMYGRAFDMVKASEQVTELDLTTFTGRMILRVVGIVLRISGWGLSMLEATGLKMAPDLDFMSLKPS